MKQYLNTLFVTTEGAYLAKEGQAVAVRIDKETRLRVPLHNLDAIVCFGRVGCSPAIMAACAEAGVSLSLLSMHGRFLASVVGYTPGNVLLRRQQYRDADNEEATCEFARSFVIGKLANCRSVLHRARRDTSDSERSNRLKKAANRMSASLVEAQAAKSTDTLRGIEGEAATHYFPALNAMILTNNDDFQFTRRSRRPPLDRINSLLSFVYTLLLCDVRSACESVGLDAAVGFLHRDRPGRPGLALDLMEEFRPFLADRLVLSLINRRQLVANDFVVLENGAVTLKPDSRKVVLVAWQKRKQETITHSFLDEKTTVGLLVHLQARIMARRLRGDMDAYPPYFWK